MRVYRILMFTPYYPPHIGGVEFYSQELIAQLRSRGHDVTLVTSDISFPKNSPSEKALTYPTLEVISNFPLPQFWKKEFRFLFKKLNSHTYDIVISHTRFFPISLWALLYSKKRKIPCLHIEHGSSFVMSGNTLVRSTAWLYDQIIGKYILKQADWIIAISQSVFHFLKKLTPHNEVSVIYRGIKETNPQESHPPFSINIDKPVILFIGRLVFSKGIRELLKALEANKKLSWVCYFAGDGPDRYSFEEMLRKSELSERIILLGHIDQPAIQSILSLGDIFIHPSYTEGLPTAVLEAAIAGIPIIATDVGGTKEISEMIHLVPAKDSSVLGEKIKQVLDSLSKEKEISKNMASQIKRKFSWEKSIDEFERIFSNLKSKT